MSSTYFTKLVGIFFVTALLTGCAKDLGLFDDSIEPQGSLDSEPALVLSYERGCPVYVNPKAYGIKIYEDGSVERNYYPCINFSTPDWDHPEPTRTSSLTPAQRNQLINAINSSLGSGTTSENLGETVFEPAYEAEVIAPNGDHIVVEKLETSGTDWVRRHITASSPHDMVMGLINQIRSQD